VATLLAAEALIGADYVLVGLAAIRFFEFEARRNSRGFLGRAIPSTLKFASGSVISMSGVGQGFGLVMP
jgi:hypothetical protein